MPAGRPREYDRSAIAKALLEWAQKDDSLNLNGFCVTHDPMIPPTYMSRWALENEEFSQAYELARSLLANRREIKLNKNELHVKAYDLNAAVYDYFLREERRREKEFESGLKNKKEEESQDDFIRKLVQVVGDCEEASRVKEVSRSGLETIKPLLD